MLDLATRLLFRTESDQSAASPLFRLGHFAARINFSPRPFLASRRFGSSGHLLALAACAALFAMSAAFAVGTHVTGGVARVRRSLDERRDDQSKADEDKDLHLARNYETISQRRGFFEVRPHRRTRCFAAPGNYVARQRDPLPHRRHCRIS